MSQAEHASSRRALLTQSIIGATALAAPTTVPAAIPEADPHGAWLREWRELIYWCEHRSGEAEKVDLDQTPQCQRADELEDLIGCTEARTLDGAANQVRFAHETILLYGQALDATEAALENAVATFDRLAGRASA